MELLKAAGAEAKKLLESLEGLFRTHPTVEELHVTGDNQFFLDKNQADNYAWRLRNKGVATVTRTDFEAIKSNTAISPAEPAATPIGDASLMHPEATMPGPGQVAEKQQADQQAQQDVTAQLNAAVEIASPEAPLANEAPAIVPPAVDNQQETQKPTKETK